LYPEDFKCCRTEQVNSLVDLVACRYGAASPAIFATSYIRLSETSFSLVYPTPLGPRLATTVHLAAIQVSQSWAKFDLITIEADYILATTQACDAIFLTCASVSPPESSGIDRPWCSQLNVTTVRNFPSSPCYQAQYAGKGWVQWIDINKNIAAVLTSPNSFAFFNISNSNFAADAFSAIETPVEYNLRSIAVSAESETVTGSAVYLGTLITTFEGVGLMDMVPDFKGVYIIGIDTKGTDLWESYITDDGKTLLSVKLSAQADAKLFGYIKPAPPDSDSNFYRNLGTIASPFQAFQAPCSLFQSVVTQFLSNYTDPRTSGQNLRYLPCLVF